MMSANTDICIKCVHATGAVAIPRAFFGEGTGRIHLDDVNCERTETSLMQCQSSEVSNHNCGHSEDAGVICIGELRTISICWL